MTVPICVQVRARLFSDDEHIGSLQAPTRSLSEHVTTCRHCRAGVVQALTTLLGASFAEPGDYIEHEEDLAAFIDIERADGVHAAVMQYPHIWWHLWCCVDCVEDYQRTLALLDAEERGKLTALPLLVPAPSPERPHVREFRLPQIIFSHLFMAYAQLGPAWGAHDDESVVFDQENQEYNFNVSVKPQNGGLWNIIVSVTPPVAHAITVALGKRLYHAYIDPDGRARIGPLTQAELQGDLGAEMVITLHDACT
jgi:hypothetical protein